MNKKKYSCIIYDLDGTLVDSSVDLANAINYARKQQDLKPITVTEVVSYTGGGVKNLVELCFHEKHSDKELGVKDFKKCYNRETVVKSELYPGVMATMKELHERGVIQAIATNKPEIYSTLIIEKLGLSDYISTLIGGENAQGCALKPKPASLEFIAREQGIKIENCLMVGDNHTDLEAANNCNMDVVFCTYGFGEHDKNPYTYRINKFAKLLEIIEE